MNNPTVMSNKELRACAREQLKGVWGKMALAFFILFLIYLTQTILSCLDVFIDSHMISSVCLVLTFAYYIAIGPFNLGFAGFLLKRVRGEEIFIKNIFDGFKRVFQSFLLWLLTVIFVFLWGLLLIIPGIIKTFSYSMAYYIMYDNPEIEAIEALNQSKIMMNGYKWKLFLLFLSFIGWVFLALLTLGIGFFWLYPYIGLSISNFYEDLKINQRATEQKI